MKKIVVHCETAELWRKVEEKAVRLGIPWPGSADTLLNRWSSNKEQSCIFIGEVMTWGVLKYVKEKGYKIILAEEYLKEEVVKEVKVKEVIPAKKVRLSASAFKDALSQL